eukprot:SAG22_NODE_613_length_8567_cov_4.215163_12_plen_59_part_00
MYLVILSLSDNNNDIGLACTKQGEATVRSYSLIAMRSSIRPCNLPAHRSRRWDWHWGH